MEVSVRQDGTTCVMAVTGKFQSHGFNKWKSAYAEAIASEAIEKIEVDLSGVRHIDSSGLGMLVLLRADAIKQGKPVLLRITCNKVRRAVETANFQQIFEIL